MYLTQDDKEEKLKGVNSLIKYATLSDYMLVPTDLDESAPFWLLIGVGPQNIPGYGKRAWCRVEYFIFSLAAEMRESGAVELYAIKRNGELEAYPFVKVRR